MRSSIIIAFILGCASTTPVITGSRHLRGHEAQSMPTPTLERLEPTTLPAGQVVQTASDQTSVADPEAETLTDAMPPTVGPRVRKEWRTLSEETKMATAKAMWTLKNVSTANGRQIYGPRFMNHDDLLLQHACAVKVILGGPANPCSVNRPSPPLTNITQPRTHAATKATLDRCS